MNLFRSEEHIKLWLGGRAAGETITISMLSKLAHAWWDDRLVVDWRPHSREKNQKILDSLGLSGEFWRLP
ncbi:MAG TPA: hypothetical protein VKT51_13215 [Candidatus Eremiobacteraceae bacterium]|nr:hypothetical protein [Candidatus Eremiobacteraceae bacterium]